MSAQQPETKTRKCAICDKQQDPKYRPFCSKRHADLDLHRWLSGGYSIPGSADSAEDGVAGEGGDEDEVRGGGSGDETLADIRRGRG